MVLNGIDIASYQSGMNTGTISADFIILKATEGTGYINPTWRSQADKALAAGKKIGFYHFQRGGNPVAEADYFVKTVKPYIGRAILVLDYEASDAPGTGGAKQWLDRVYATTGVRPLIYTSTSWENSRDFSAIAAANYGLWIAQYNNYNVVSGYQPRDLYGHVNHWKNIAMFQYTSSGRLGGWGGNLDFDVFYGDRAAWYRYAAVNGKVAAPVAKPAVTKGVHFRVPNGFTPESGTFVNGNTEIMTRLHTASVHDKEGGYLPSHGTFAYDSKKRIGDIMWVHHMFGDNDVYLPTGDKYGAWGTTRKR
ncbi:GH25 family lysozyme [Lacticaseibacillus baoqingensis]|uniref:GH25 family lysozyme n=1 Tax=Lacticaseibacillus baoqingensis TaxID=2486013 RepID=A0ABW4EAB0_9LACO|nr:GH25 family lysozyme [Lacticaseibacillus baoqingensis]